MGVNGLLTDVRWEWTGTEVTTDLVAGTTVLPVLDPLSVTADEDVWIADTGPYTISDTDEDASTFTLTSGLQVDVDSGTEVAKDIGGQPGRAWVCEVVLADADEPIEVPLTIHDLSVMPEGSYDPPVAIVLSDDLQGVEDLPGSMPVIDGVYIPPDSLPPGPQGVPGPPGADGSPQYTWVKYADSPVAGMSDDPTGKAYMGLSYNHDDPTESSNYADYQWSKVQGDPGPPAGVVDLTSNTQVLTQPAGGGVTVPATAVVTGTSSNTTISVYEYSSDGTPFSTTVPQGVNRVGDVVTITGATMIAKSITVRMADAAGISDSLSVARVQEGAGGAPGPQGPPGVGVSSTAVTYQVGSSGTSAPTGAWLTTPPATTPGTFLWTRTVTTYTDASTSTAYSVAAHGTTGLPGAPGADGDDGSPGAPGRGISSTAVTYQVGSSGTVAPTGTWVPSPQPTAVGEFLWTRTITTYTDTTSSTAYSVAAHGATGQPGADGAPGIGITGTVVTYQVGSSATSAPTGVWASNPQATAPGEYLWTRTVTSYSTGAPTTAYSVAAHGSTGSNGSPGNPGAPGVGITGTTVMYQVGNSGTSAPTGTWQSTPQVTTPGTFLWTRTVTNYSDSTSSTAYSVSAHGATGSQGSPGNPGAPGVGVTGTAVTYQVGSSGTSAPTGAWSSTPQATTPGTFLWTRTITTYSDSTTSTAYSVAAHGTTGLPGSPGAPGSDGSPGAPGVGVSATAVTYQTASSGTVAPTGTWVSNPPATAPGQFLWTRTITTYTDATTSTAYSVAAHGTTGNPGADAYTLSNSNQAHTFPGSVTAALAGSTTTTISALKGINPINASLSLAAITPAAPAGMTLAVSGSPGSPVLTVTVTTALVQQNGIFTLPVVVDGFTFNQTFSWSVSRQGTNGTPGTPGADGTPRYTWTKYADNATGTVGFSDTPTGTSKYLGMAYNQTTLVESNIPGDYQWSLIQGPQGPQGPPGATGTPGSKTDGLPPTLSVTNLTVTGGIGALFVRWTPIVNPDPVTYDLHVSLTSGFTPDASTLVVSTMASSHTIRALVTPMGSPPSVELAYDTDYYVRVIARDPDPGTGPVSPQSWGRILRVTGPDIVTDSITGDHIQGDSISGHHLAGDIIMGSTISTGQMDENGNIVGARVELGPDGLTNYASDGHAVVKFPTDPTDDAYVEAHMHMLSADVDDHFTLNGINNAVSASASILLAAGVTAPTTPPTLGVTYDTVRLDTVTKLDGGTAMGSFSLDPSQITSMIWDTAWACWQVWQQKSNGFRLWRFNANGSLTQNAGKPWFEDWAGTNNKTTGCRSGWMFQYGGSTATWYVWSTIEGGQRYGTIPNSWILPTAQQPFLAYDEAAGLFMLCQNNTSAIDTFQVRRFHTVPYVGGNIQPCVSDSVTTGPLTTQRSGGITGVYFGPADFGGNRYVVGAGAYSTLQVWTTTQRYNTNGNFQDFNTNGLHKAFAWDGTNFWSVDSTGLMTKYTNWTWTADPPTTYVGMSGFDSRTAGDQANPWPGQSAGQHETPVGTLAPLAMARRSKLTITVPVTKDAGGNDDLNQWKVYWARSLAVPTKTDMKFVATLGSNTVPQSVTMTGDSVGANPPGGMLGQPGAANNFPAGNPAILTSAGVDTLSVPLINLKGDGSGRMGPFKWDNLGRDLVKNGTAMAFTSAHAASMTNASFTTLGGWSGDSSQFAPTGSFISGVGSGLFTFTVPGVYQIIASGTISTGGGANPQRRIIAIFRGATEVQRFDSGASSNGSNPVTMQVSTIMRMAAGDTFSVQLWQNSGATITAGASPGHECFIIKLSD